MHLHEKRYAGPFVVIGSLLFILGGAFSLKIVTPSAVSFMLSYARPGLQPMISIDSYVGYHCLASDGSPCYERTFTGMAQVRWPGFSGVWPFLVDTIDYAGSGPTTPNTDYIDFNGGGYINVSLVNQGGIAIHNASPAPGCD